MIFTGTRGASNNERSSIFNKRRKPSQQLLLFFVNFLLNYFSICLAPSPVPISLVAYFLLKLLLTKQLKVASTVLANDLK